jgi:outer membrane protein OmpA-like peptidoglycan-associated protein
MRTILLLLAVGSVATLPGPAHAQFTKRIGERIKQAVADKTRQTEENALNRAAEPADSAMARIAAPVESVTAQVGGKAGAAVGRLGRGKDGSTEEEGRIRKELASGRAELPGVTFEQGGYALAASSDPTLRALVRIMSDTPGAFLIQLRTDPGDAANPPQLAGPRAAAVKGWLVTNGIPAERVFATADGARVAGQSSVTVTVMQ